MTTEETKFLLKAKAEQQELIDSLELELTALRTKLAEREWISCEERLPDLNVKVLCVKDRSKRSKHTIVEQDVRSLLSNHDNHWMNTPKADKVTHWQPLPAPPAISQDKGESV